MKTRRWTGILVASVVLVAAVIAFTSLTGAAAPSNLNSVGIVDMEKLHTELLDFQDLQAMANEKENGLKSFQGYLLSQHRVAAKELQDKFDKEKTGKSAEDQKTLEKRYQDELRKKGEELNKQLVQERTKILKELDEQKKKADERMREMISTVAADKKLSVVFDKNAVLFGGTDITDLVIKKAKKDDTKKAADEKKKKKK
jgi:Skp family chaperone for outer membrane proteins